MVCEALIDVDRSRSAMGLLTSLNMLIEALGSFDYTSADCTKWMRETGFSSVCVEPLPGAESMVIAICN